MTSIYSADNPYYAEGPSRVQTYSYRPNSAMDIIYQKSPIFAHCLQKVGMDTWVDEEGFNSTCLVPSTQYCVKNLKTFMDVDIATARRIVMSSIIRGNVEPIQLLQQELVPNILNQYVFINGTTVNGLNIQQFMCADNGAVYFLDGVIDPTENYLD